LHDTGAQFGDAGIGVWGLDWLPRGDIQAAFQTVPEDTDILITHQVWKDFMGEIGRTECELTDVHHVQTVLAGDFHVTKIAESVNAQGKPIKMLSPGSTAMQDMGEQPAKFFFVISEHDAEIIFEAKPLKTRGTLSYVVKEAELLDELCAGKLTREIEKLVEDSKAAGHHPDIHKPLVRVKFDKRLPDAFLRVTTVVSDSAHLFCEALTDKMLPRQNSQARDAVKNDLLSALSDLLGGENEAYKLASALLTAEEPGKEFDVQLSKFMNEEPNATSETGSEELGSPSAADV